MATLLGSTDLQAHKSVVGRSAVSIGPAAADYDELGTMRTVGSTDGTVDISPNQEIVKLQSSALLNSYSVIETGFDYQVTFSLQEFDIWNIALALSYNAGNVTASTALTLDASNQSSLRSMRIRHNGALRNPGDTSGVADFEFWKIKIVSNGGISFDRTGAAMLPVVAHCLGNDVDAVGQYLTSVGELPIDRDYEDA